MNEAAPAIGIVQDGDGADVQRLFRGFVQRWKAKARIVGVIEEGDGEGLQPRNARHLVSVLDGARFRIFQDLGPGSTACQIDPDSLASAGEAVRRHIEMGCDLVILSKFARLEAERRGGLMPALVSAAEAGIPLLTSVGGKFDAAWHQFAENNYASLSPDQPALEHWWHKVRGSARPQRI
ncbi:MAG TPA: DUF2478 domain-containing protein [Allosphingosinicella sp.]|nr:DUF2478 domain-containing protein [Allosphingosinicella sp.]